MPEANSVVLTGTSRALSVLVLTIAVLAARPAFPQTIPEPTGMPVTVQPGLRVSVVDRTGARTRGTLLEVSPEALLLSTEGPLETARRIPLDDVVTVAQRDSRRDGFWIGFAAGLVPGLLFARYVNSYCANEGPSPCPVAAFGVYAGGAGLLGGWIGASVDGATDGPTLFSRQDAQTRVAVAPFVAPGGRRGMALSLRF